MLVRKYFSEAKKRRGGDSLDKYESNKGIKRTILTAIPTGGGSVAGYIVGKKAANEADEEGLSDEKIVEKARSKGMKYGAAIGGTLGAVSGLSNRGLGGALGSGVVLAGLGALGGRNAAGVNTKDRLYKRNLKKIERMKDREEKD